MRGVLQSGATLARRVLKEPMPTETPPPYFPQNTLSPGDEKTARRVRLAFYGCVLLALAALVCAVVGAVYLVRWLL